MSSIFGGQKQSSSSSNQAYPMLSSALGGNITQGNNAGNQIANMLGLNGPQGQNQAFQNWQNSTGYQFGLNQGMQSINGNAAAQGLLNSGATGKALETYGQNYANTQYGNYVNQLMGLFNGGLQSGQVISGAGNRTQSSGSSTPGFFGNNGAASGFVGDLLTK